MLKKILPLLPVVLLAGCATPNFTRLTPVQETRNADNLYAVETAFDSKQQSIRWDSIHAFIIVNGQAMPMRKVSLVKNRWEGVIPVPPGVATVNYRFKFDYLYNSFASAPKPNSVTSQVYTLKIAEQ